MKAITSISPQATRPDRATLDTWTRELQEFVTEIRFRLNRTLTLEDEGKSHQPVARAASQVNGPAASSTVDDASDRLRSIKERLAAQLRIAEESIPGSQAKH